MITPGVIAARITRRAVFLPFALLLLGFAVAPAAHADDRFSFGGELRPRLEMVDRFGLNANTPEANTMVWLRTRLHADARITDGVFARIELQDAHRWGEAAANASRTTDLADISLREAYVEFSGLADDRLEFRLGRQAIILGAERLLGDLDWHWNGRTHDAILSTWRVNDHHRWHALAIAVNENDQPGLTAAQKGGRDGDAWVTGISGDLTAGGIRWEPFWIFTDLDSSTLGTLLPQAGILNAAAPGRAGDLHAQTLGLRARGKAWPRVTWEAEAHYQHGSLGGFDLSAHALHFSAAYAARTALLDRVTLGVDRWSGDRDPGDGRLGTYQPAFPSYYEHIGILGRLGMKNLDQLRITLAGPLVAEWRWRADAHLFRLASARDHAWTPAGALLAATGTAAGSRGIGTEYDLAFLYPWNRHVTFMLAGSHFRSAGRLAQAIRNTGGAPAAAITTIAQVEVKF